MCPTPFHLLPGSVIRDPPRRRATAEVKGDFSSIGGGEHVFVNAPEHTCKDVWASWPSIQEKGLADGNVIVFKIFASVGNLFIVLQRMISVRAHRRESTRTDYFHDNGLDERLVERCLWAQYT